MTRIILALTLLALAACRSDHITLETTLWHSEICHPEIFYVGEPPNAVAECKWTAVYPHGHGYQIR